MADAPNERPQPEPSRLSRPVDNSGAARRLLREARKAALGTLMPDGAPFVSVVALALEPWGHPIILISRLAVHTRNLARDPRASLLVDGTGDTGNLQDGGRLSLIGELTPAGAGTHRERYLSRHPDAALYVDFPDFCFHVMTVSRAHYVGGFGRIADLEPAALFPDPSACAAVASAERDLLDTILAAPGVADRLVARVLGDAMTADGSWRVAGVDAAGLDLVSPSRAVRLDFDAPLATPERVRAEIARLISRN
ncbi:MAG: pyridoxamine 5'-phosphate oxidase family protein [Hyphomicrobiaceae bacterium]|nr:pyridoxamine 5'-phosphate oxidase family protein [Hyphomicrobiaceae bacterium]